MDPFWMLVSVPVSSSLPDRERLGMTLTPLVLPG